MDSLFLDEMYRNLYENIHLLEEDRRERILINGSSKTKRVSGRARQNNKVNGKRKQAELKEEEEVDLSLSSTPAKKQRQETRTSPKTDVTTATGTATTAAMGKQRRAPPKQRSNEELKLKKNIKLLWSDNDIEKLLNAVQKHGQKWIIVSKELENRTPDAVSCILLCKSFLTFCFCMAARSNLLLFFFFLYHVVIPISVNLNGLE